MTKKEKDQGLKEYNSLHRSNFIPSNNLAQNIKNLSNPRFLGSIHLKEELNPNYSHIKDLIANERDLKLTSSLMNTLLNPITKILIISAILFNLIWFLSFYLF